MSTKMKFELLPNEIFIECFQYLNAPDIFHLFDRLNYRFHTLTRNIPLHLNFQQLKKSSFNEFYQTIVSNPEIKQNIISLQLSNKGTCGQIQSFLSCFSLKEFMNLRSLSLIDINDDNAKQVVLMLPFLSNLYYLYCTGQRNEILQIIPTLSTSKIRILKVSHFFFDSRCFNGNMSLVSLTVSLSLRINLCLILQYTPMLKYLKTEQLFDDDWSFHVNNKFDFSNINAVHLKQFIISNCCQVYFNVFELILKQTPNLEIFSIYSRNASDIADANRWEHLIESSLRCLRVFNFHFEYTSFNNYNEILIKFSAFQSHFWYEQHHWYINFQIDGNSFSIYTIPYQGNDYTLTSTMQRQYFTAKLFNEFDNVKNLSLCTSAFRDDLSYFFRNVQSLTLTSKCDLDDDIDKYTSKNKIVKYLNKIVNVSNIKNLTIKKGCLIEASLLLEILKTMPNASSLTMEKKTLISFLNHPGLSNI